MNEENPNADTTADTATNDAEQTDQSEQSEEQQLVEIALEDLKNRARTLGVQFHPSIGEGKLREKIAEKQAADLLREEAGKAGEEQRDDEGLTDSPVQADPAKNAGSQLKAKQAAKALKRVRITCMDPAKKEYPGEIFSVSNSIVGTLKRYIPFGAPWHLETMMLNMLREKKYQAFSMVKTPNGGEVKRGRLVPAYAIEELPALSTTEMEALRQRQLARRDVDEGL